MIIEVIMIGTAIISIIAFIGVWIAHLTEMYRAERYIEEIRSENRQRKQKEISDLAKKIESNRRAGE